MNRFMIGLAVVGGLSLTTGCAGNLYTITEKELACVRTDAGECTNKYEGVLYRPLVMHEEHYVLDRILNVKGEVTHFANSSEGEKACMPVPITEVKLIPNPDKEHVVQYAPAFFETSTFTAKLSPLGTLTEVGTSSTPGGKELVEGFTGLATTVKILNHGVMDASAFTDGADKPACSHGRLPIPSPGG